jgi:hypothetical protein
MEGPTHISMAASESTAERRSRISSEASIEKVGAKIEPDSAPFSRRYLIRRTSVRVLPVPEPASTKSGPSCHLAAACWLASRTWGVG